MRKADRDREAREKREKTEVVERFRASATAATPSAAASTVVKHPASTAVKHPASTAASPTSAKPTGLKSAGAKSDVMALKPIVGASLLKGGAKRVQAAAPTRAFDQLPSVVTWLIRLPQVSVPAEPCLLSHVLCASVIGSASRLCMGFSHSVSESTVSAHTSVSRDRPRAPSLFDDVRRWRLCSKA